MLDFDEQFLITDGEIVNSTNELTYNESTYNESFSDIDAMSIGLVNFDELYLNCPESNNDKIKIYKITSFIKKCIRICLKNLFFFLDTKIISYVEVIINGLERLALEENKNKIKHEFDLKNSSEMRVISFHRYNKYRRDIFTSMLVILRFYCYMKHYIINYTETLSDSGNALDDHFYKIKRSMDRLLLYAALLELWGNYIISCVSSLNTFKHPKYGDLSNSALLKSYRCKERITIDRVIFGRYPNHFDNKIKNMMKLNYTTSSYIYGVHEPQIYILIGHLCDEKLLIKHDLNALCFKYLSSPLPEFINEYTFDISIMKLSQNVDCISHFKSMMKFINMQIINPDEFNVTVLKSNDKNLFHFLIKQSRDIKYTMSQTDEDNITIEVKQQDHIYSDDIDNNDTTNVIRIDETNETNEKNETDDTDETLPSVLTIRLKRRHAASSDDIQYNDTTEDIETLNSTDNAISENENDDSNFVIEIEKDKCNSKCFIPDKFGCQPSEVSRIDDTVPLLEPL
jgi:hypothetical protein